jgi:hypothetical protein
MIICGEFKIVHINLAGETGNHSTNLLALVTLSSLSNLCQSTIWQNKVSVLVYGVPRYYNTSHCIDEFPLPNLSHRDIPFHISQIITYQMLWLCMFHTMDPEVACNLRCVAKYKLEYKTHTSVEELHDCVLHIGQVVIEDIWRQQWSSS